MTGFEWLITTITSKFTTYVVETVTVGMDKSSKSFLDKANPIQQKLNSAEWKLFCKEYYTKIEEEYGKITLLLSGGERVNLENFYVDLYLSDRSFWGDNKRINGRQLLVDQHNNRLITKNENEFIYIEGHPGMGKTTFMKYAAFLASKGEIEKVPIFVNLLNLSISKLSLAEFLVLEFDNCGFPESKHLIDFLLKQGKAIILFDGLDEVSEENERRDNIISGINSFCFKHKSKGNKFLISCRIAANRQDFKDFTYFRLAEFTDEQIERLINKWYANKDNTLKEKLIKEIFEEKHETILEIGRQPLLLLMICFSYYQRKGEFPKNKIDIYETSIDALLNEWDEKKGVKRKFYDDLPTNAIKDILGKIAYDNFSSDNEAFSKFKKTYLENIIAEQISEITKKDKRLIPSRFILQDLEAHHGILIEVEDRIFKFPHLSFQEYFAAKYLVDNNILTQLLTKERIIQDRWREVILNTTALLNNCDEFFVLLQESVNQIIADEPYLIKLVKQVDKKVNRVKSDEKINAKRLFYIYLTLLSDLDEGLARDINLDLVKDLYHDFDIALPHAIDLDLPNSLLRLRNCALNPVLNSVLDFDYQLYVCRKSISIYYLKRQHLANQEDSFIGLLNVLEYTIEKGKQLDEKNIVNDLRKLAGFNKDFNDEDHNSAVEILDNALRSRGIKSDLNFYREQIQTLNNYFTANKLLLECLQLAVVSDSQAIEDKMFLPIESD
jgi:NACHT domain